MLDRGLAAHELTSVMTAERPLCESGGGRGSGLLGVLAEALDAEPLEVEEAMLLRERRLRCARALRGAARAAQLVVTGRLGALARARLFLPTGMRFLHHRTKKKDMRRKDADRAGGRTVRGSSQYSARRARMEVSSASRFSIWISSRRCARARMREHATARRNAVCGCLVLEWVRGEVHCLLDADTLVREIRERDRVRILAVQLHQHLVRILLLFLLIFLWCHCISAPRTARGSALCESAARPPRTADGGGGVDEGRGPPYATSTARKPRD